MSDDLKKVEFSDDNVDGEVKNLKKSRGVKKPNLDDDNLKKVSNKNKKGLVKDMSDTQKPNYLTNVVISILVVLVGIASGYGLSGVQANITGVGNIKSTEKAAEEGIKVGDMIGSDDSSFRNEAEGVLLKGGIDGEGSHRILRPGGESQTVYLTSSVVDLDQFIGHKVRVWGETFSAQKAGWLMDAGRIEVLELNAQKPFEEEIE